MHNEHGFFYDTNRKPHFDSAEIPSPKRKPFKSLMHSKTKPEKYMQPVKLTSGILKFQRAAEKAIQMNKQKRDFTKSSESKRKPQSIFDIVKKLNPFAGVKRDRVRPEDTISQNQTQRGLLDSERKQKLIEDEAAKRERARQLWRKAKGVLRAILIWKAVQTEIQLYGTHNYEFRRNFKMNRQQTQLNRSITRDQNLKPQKKKCKVYFHPEGKFKKAWSVVVVFLLTYVATIMPFNIAFYDFDVDDDWYYVDTIIDFAFVTDLIVNVFSAYIDDEGKLITNNKKILLHYLKGWFIIDLIASFPFNLIQREVLLSPDTAGNYNQILRLLRLPRLYRLLKITRLIKLVSFLKKNPFIQKIQDFLQINAGVLRLIQFIITAFICVHLAACLWYLSAKLDNFQPQTWVVRFGVEDSSIGRQYLASIYWSITTVLTVGYGDIHAATNTERLISVLWMMIGVGFYSFTIGTLTSVLSRIDTRSSQLKAKIEVIEIFCQEAKISPDIKKKIKEALEYNSLRNAFSWIEKYAIFNELPPNLKCEVAMQIHDGAIGKLPFFQNKDQAFIGNVVPLLQPLRVNESDYIYMQDDHPYDIYFIVKGRVNFVMEIGECVFKQWPQGSYFGEIEIIFNIKRVCTAKAAVDCDLFTLNKKFYQQVIIDYPEVDQKLKEVAEEREKKILITLRKARKVLDAVGISENIYPIRRGSKVGSQGSLHSQATREYIHSVNKNSKQQVAQSFDKGSRRKSSRGSGSKSGSRKSDNKDDFSEQNESDTESSGDEFNIWGEKENDDSSENNKNSKKNSNNDQSARSSFKTDKSLKIQTQNDSPLLKENKKRRSTLQVQQDKVEKRFSISDLPQVEEESVESGSIRKPRKSQPQNEEYKMDSPEDLEESKHAQIEEIKEDPETMSEKKMFSQEESIPKIRILQEPSTIRQDSQEPKLSFPDNENSPDRNQSNYLDIIPQNFQDSNFFSTQNPDSPPHLFKGSSHAESSIQSQHSQELLDSNNRREKEWMRKLSQPKIKINDNTYIFPKDEDNKQSEASASMIYPLSEDRSFLKVESNIVNLSYVPSKMKQKARLNKQDFQQMNQKVNLINERINSNKQQSQQIVGKVTEISSNLNSITKMIMDITKQQKKEKKKLDQKEEKIKYESQKQSRNSNFQDPNHFYLQLSSLKNEQLNMGSNRSQNIGLNPQSFSLNSNNSLVPVQRQNNEGGQYQALFTPDKSMEQPEIQNRNSRRQQPSRFNNNNNDQSYLEDLQQLQEQYGNEQSFTNRSLPDQ